MHQDETVWQARRFRVVRRTHATRDGRTRVHEFVQHPGAVTILPLVDAERVCLIRNQRPSVDQVLVELPAGTLESGEQPLAAAYRELEEETGFRAAKMALMCEFFMSPGVLDERMRIYLATDLTTGPRNLDDGEEIDNLIVSWDEAMRMVRSGAIQDAKTLVGLLWYDAARRSSPS